MSKSPYRWTILTSLAFAMVLAFSLPSVASADPSAPSTTASPTPVGSFNNAAVFSLTATEPAGPGVANTFFRLDGGAVTTYSVGFAIVPIFSSVGTHTLTYYSTDTLGNTEGAHTSTFTVNDTLPPTTVTDVAPTYADVATITLSASDNQFVGLGYAVTAIGSGVAGTHWSLDGGSTWTTGTQVVESQASTTPYTLLCYSTDVAGNRETTGSASFRVNDTIAPVTSSDATSSYVGTATIHFTAHDNSGGLGVGATYYSLDGGGFVQGTSVTTTATGSHSLLFYSTDKASPTPNSESVKSVNFAVTAFDTTPPTSSSDATASYIVTATVHISATDNPGGIGVGAIYYKLDGASVVTTVVAVGSPTTLTAPVVVTGAGSHSIEFWSADLLGNVESPHHTVNFTIGKLSSTISISAVPASVKLPKPFVLSGLLTVPTNGLSCVVYVKKPGSARWSYSSNRLSYNAAGAASSWWYRYTPKLRGTYSFYVNFAGDGTHIAVTSRTIKVTVK
jgi:hypothetical protein